MALRLRWQTLWPEAEARAQIERALGPAGLNLPVVEPPEPAAIAFRLDHAVVVARLEAAAEGTAVQLEAAAWDPRLLELERWLAAPPPTAPPEAPFARP